MFLLVLFVVVFSCFRFVYHAVVFFVGAFACLCFCACCVCVCVCPPVLVSFDVRCLLGCSLFVCFFVSDWFVLCLLCLCCPCFCLVVLLFAFVCMLYCRCVRLGRVCLLVFVIVDWFAFICLFVCAC